LLIIMFLSRILYIAHVLLVMVGLV